MMGLLITIAGLYLMCCAAAYKLLWRDQALTFGKITRGDRRFITMMSSFGPISLCAALVIFAINEHDWNNDEVIWRRPKE